jgi:hypothetical protein
LVRTHAPLRAHTRHQLLPHSQARHTCRHLHHARPHTSPARTLYTCAHHAPAPSPPGRTCTESPALRVKDASLSSPTRLTVSSTADAPPPRWRSCPPRAIACAAARPGAAPCWAGAGLRALARYSTPPRLGTPAASSVAPSANTCSNDGISIGSCQHSLRCVERRCSPGKARAASNGGLLAQGRCAVGRLALHASCVHAHERPERAGWQGRRARRQAPRGP